MQPCDAALASILPTIHEENRILTWRIRHISTYYRHLNCLAQSPFLRIYRYQVWSRRIRQIQETEKYPFHHFVLKQTIYHILSSISSISHHIIKKRSKSFTTFIIIHHFCIHQVRHQQPTSVQALYQAAQAT